ncbi:MAG: hypothetical protein GY814_03290 [Gammaproteobacteria bacterium]|nr:hypothetical protein [Gammaproteobacteria bacterium]
MKKAKARQDIAKALEGLKPFQEATVDAATERLLLSDQRHLLVADETGLGKTIVAKGLIARMLGCHLDGGKRKPLKVTYICSNQAIAGENIEKLNFLSSELVTLRKGNRIAYMARADEEQVGQNTVLEISTLTPATSFQTSQSQGSQWERILIFTALLDGEPAFRRYGKSVATILRGAVQRSEWEEDIRQGYREENSWQRLRNGFGDQYIKFLRKTNAKGFLTSYEIKHLLVDVEGESLLDLIWFWVRYVQPARPKPTHWYCNQLIKVLRRAMTQVCLKTVKADLYILDEFQRFERLIRIHESAKQDQEAEETSIARDVFGNTKCKVLMLSATPFKAYSGHDDQDGSDAHYRELLTVLRFLLDDDHDKLKTFEFHRRALYRQLSNLKPKNSQHIDPVHKNAVEEILRPVICRTERVQNSLDFNSMVQDSWKEKPLQISQGDVRSYIATDQTIRQLSKIAGDKEMRGIQPIEYCKSAPHVLSFLHGYKVRRILDDSRFRRNRSLRKAVKAQSCAWLDMSKLADYRWAPRDEPEELRSSRLLRLLDEAMPKEANQLLWVPPSLSYYPLEGVFTSATGFSKTLVFSSWLMVPRMISTLISYEVERMTIGDPRSVDKEQEERHFFAAEDRRHPRPLLTFAVKGHDDGGDDLLSRMTNFCLLYPSRTLAEIADPERDYGTVETLSDYRQEISRKIDQRLQEINHSQFEGSGTSSERWYWMAPLLLDRGLHYEETKQWLNDSVLRSDNSFFRADTDGSSGRARYFNRLVENFEKPEDAGLGPIPLDLVEVLTDMAIASPASVSYRALRSVQSNPLTLRSWAMTVADGFVTLFNKPESIAAIRIANHDNLNSRKFWRQVLNYCTEGCLQAVLDEYIHILREQFMDNKKLMFHVRDSISLVTSSYRVDDINWYLGKSAKTREMRTHVAVQLGNQRLETPEGEKRVASLRQNFNSPFRPFVMATTSIGQEGLDFHAYCRRIVHWNLPSNPIDLEQREGRINRYKCLAIRQEIAARYGDSIASEIDNDDIWERLFQEAHKREPEAQKGSGLVPYWAVQSEKFPIERVVPLYPFSKDGARLLHILRTLAIYRLVFGQPRQSELIEYLQENFNDEEITTIRDKLMIDLSPYNYRR